MALNSILKPNSLRTACISIVPRATICHKSLLPEKKARNFPYEKVPWNFLTFWLDPLTKNKFDENSKVIQIEGNIGSGKGEFGKVLGEELGMKFFPHPNLESVYYNSHGFDYRSLNPQLPERLRICDFKMFHENPSRHSAIHLLHFLFTLKLEQYLFALAHLFNTGQGVILERSPFTDKVLVDAMHKVGWLPMGHVRHDGVRFFDWVMRYNYIRACTLAKVLKPHLTIYLDVPAAVCKQNLEKSPDPMIKNSKALVLPYLEAIQHEYETDMLRKAATYGHTMKIENYHDNGMSPRENALNILGEVSMMDFDTREIKGDKFKTWLDKSNFYYGSRNFYTSRKQNEIYCYLSQPTYDIAGLGDSITTADLILRQVLIENHVIGLRRDIEDDIEQSGFWSSVFNYKPFRVSMRRNLFSDFN